MPVLRRSLLALSLALSTGWADEVNIPAPDFTLKSASGKNVRRDEYVGQVLVLAFTSDKCGGCKEMFRQLAVAMKPRKEAGLQVFGISQDDSLKGVKDTAKDQRAKVTMLWDEHKRMSWQYGVTELPTLLIVDRDGHIRHRFVGQGARNITDLSGTIQAIAEE